MHRLIETISQYRLIIVIRSALFVCWVMMGTAVSQAAPTQATETPVKLSLNAPFDGSNAAFFLAQQKGYYAAAGLAVDMDPSGGSGEAVTRIGSQSYDFGFADINVLMEFDAKNPANAGKAVYMLYYRSPLAVASFAKTDINKPSDLAGKKIGGSLGDGAYKLFPVYADLTGLKADAVKWEFGDLRLRESMMLKGDVDALLGFDSTMYFALTRHGINPADIKFLYYADAGLPLYGNAIVASKKMLDTHPDVVQRFVAASAKGWRDAIADPAAAIAALKKQSPMIDDKLELEKLQWLIKNQITTSESKTDGLGGIRNDRMEQSVATLTKAFTLPTRPAVADFYSSAYLPAADVRKLP